MSMASRRCGLIEVWFMEEVTSLVWLMVDVARKTWLPGGCGPARMCSI